MMLRSCSLSATNPAGRSPGWAGLLPRAASLPPIVRHGFRMNQYSEQLGRILFKPNFECGLHIVYARERHVVGQRAVTGNVQPVANLLELKLMQVNHFRELFYNFL